MDNQDEWLALDKLYHVLFCFTLTLIFSALATRTRYAFIRRHSIFIGSIASLAAGAAKEAADEIGFFKSAGASAKDAVSDVIGVLIASIFLIIYKYFFRADLRQGQARGILPL